MASLAQSVKDGAVNTTETLKVGYYVINFVSETYTLQYGTTYDIQIRIVVKIVVKSQYLICTQERQVGIGSIKSSNK